MPPRVLKLPAEANQSCEDALEFSSVIAPVPMFLIKMEPWLLFTVRVLAALS